MASLPNGQTPARTKTTTTREFLLLGFQALLAHKVCHTLALAPAYDGAAKQQKTPSLDVSGQSKVDQPGSESQQQFALGTGPVVLLGAEDVPMLEKGGGVGRQPLDDAPGVSIQGASTKPNENTISVPGEQAPRQDSSAPAQVPAQTQTSAISKTSTTPAQETKDGEHAGTSKQEFVDQTAVVLAVDEPKDNPSPGVAMPTSLSSSACVDEPKNNPSPGVAMPTPLSPSTDACAPLSSCQRLTTTKSKGSTINSCSSTDRPARVAGLVLHAKKSKPPAQAATFRRNVKNWVSEASSNLSVVSFAKNNSALLDAKTHDLTIASLETTGSSKIPDVSNAKNETTDTKREAKQNILSKKEKKKAKKETKEKEATFASDSKTRIGNGLRDAPETKSLPSHHDAKAATGLCGPAIQPVTFFQGREIPAKPEVVRPGRKPPEKKRSASEKNPKTHHRKKVAREDETAPSVDVPVIAREPDQRDLEVLLSSLASDMSKRGLRLVNTEPTKMKTAKDIMATYELQKEKTPFCHFIASLRECWKEEPNGLSFGFSHESKLRFPSSESVKAEGSLLGSAMKTLRTIAAIQHPIPNTRCHEFDECERWFFENPAGLFVHDAHKPGSKFFRACKFLVVDCFARCVRLTAEAQSKIQLKTSVSFPDEKDETGRAKTIPFEFFTELQRNKPSGRDEKSKVLNLFWLCSVCFFPLDRHRETVDSHRQNACSLRLSLLLSLFLPPKVV